MAEEKVLKKRNVSRNVQYRFGKAQEEERVVRAASTEMRFVSLHHHSTFSYQDAIGLPEDHAMRAAELGMVAQALTEHGNVSSHVKHEQACDDVGIKPIFGCEIYQGVPGTGTGATEKNPHNFAQSKNHLTVLAADQQGYRNLLGMVSEAWQEEWFFRNMTVTNESLARHQEGLIVLSGCTASILATAMVGGKWMTEPSYKKARKVAAKYKEILGDRFYLEVQVFPELEDVCRINQAYERLSKDLGIPLVATADVHYYEPDQARIRRVLHSIGRAKDFVELGQEWNYDLDSSHPQSDKQILEQLRRSGLSKRAAREALENTREIADRCNVKLPKAEPLTYPHDGDTEELMMEWLRDGWRRRGLSKRPKAVQRRYKEVMDMELEVFKEKGFLDYFLVVSDLVKYAKDSGVPVGPARGSAAASLVCWLLRITEVDPLRDDIPDLIFERFVDRNRADLPDIDLDYADDRREEVTEYAAAKYGRDHVSNIGTFTGFKGKNSLDDVAQVYRVPKGKVDTLKNLLIERSSGDLRASATIEDTVEMFEEAAKIIEEHPELMDATLLEGNYKTFGIHAGGLVISSQPLNDICAVYERDGRQSISLDKWDAEYLNVLKIDNLGLSTMGMIGIALNEIGMTLDELYALPLNDPETLQGFRDNDVTAVFQFDGRATRSVNQAVKPDNFQEIADINALSRPGPLHSGATGVYIDVKHGRAERPQYHPLVDEDITRGTHGCIVYQEQILRIVREVGNFDWTAASYIRKIISKKLGEQEFNRQWDKFKKGAKQNDLTEEEAKRIWRDVITAGAYAFNAAHCVSYGMLAYWTMWLKRHHPEAFFVAALRKYGGRKNSYGVPKQPEILRDTKKHGRNLDIRTPDVRYSGPSWSLSTEGGERCIRAGLAQVSGIGEVMGSRICEERDDDPAAFQRWMDLTRIKGIGGKTVEKIEQFVNSDDPFDMNLLSRTIHSVKQDIRKNKLGRIPRPTHTAAQIPYEKGADTPVVWLGAIRSRNLKDLFELHYSRTGEELDAKDVRDPELQEWVTLIGEDDTDLVDITIDRWRYPKFKKMVWAIELNTHLVLIKGVKKGFQARRAIYVSEMHLIDPS